MAMSRCIARLDAIVRSGSSTVMEYQAGGLEEEAECHVTGGGKRGTS